MSTYPLRGQVWDIQFDDDIGQHPGVVVSINPLNARLGWVIVLLITGAEGPADTHVPVGADAGLTRYPQSYVNITDMHAVDRYDLLAQRGLLAPSELDHVAAGLRIYLGLALGL